MRKLLAIAAFAALSATAAAAQSSWTAEFGIQGGFAKIKPAGTGADDAINVFDIPGGSFLYGTLGAPALYVIVPWHNKLAIEGQLGGSQLSTGTGSATVARLGLRADYALSPQFYAAVGGMANYIQGTGNPEHTQLGAQVGLGYRKRLTNSINGRLEANMAATNKKVLGAFDVYSLQLGISSAIGGGKMPAAPRRATNRAWSPAIGLSAGYANMHMVGTGTDITGVFFPAVGGGLFVVTPVPSTPTMFAIIPMGQKLAFEPALDFHSVSVTGTSIKVINVAGRLDYALKGNWYGAAGGHLMSYSPSGGTSGTVDGVDVGLGYRFHLMGEFGGRFETNYSLSAKSSKLGTPAVNTLSLSFGAMMPLK